MYSDSMRTYWFLEEDSHARAKALTAQVNSIIDGQSTTISRQNLFHAKLYANRNFFSLKGVSSTLMVSNILSDTSIGENIVQSNIDALVAKITKRDVLPKALTRAGDVEQQEKAENLNSFIQGLIYQTKTNSVATDAFTNSCVFGSGFIKVYTETNLDGSKKVGIKSVCPDEILVDEADGKYGKPRCLYEIKFYTRDKMMNLFPKFKAEIKQAKPFSNYDAHGAADVIMVMEAYCLPVVNGDGKIQKGKKVLAIENCELSHEEWTRPDFPYAKLDYQKPLNGYFGVGICELLQGIQLEINRLNHSIQKSSYLHGNPKLMVQKNSFDPIQYNEDGEDVIEYDGAKPDIWNPNAFPTGAIQQKELLKQSAFNQIGLSQLSAQSQKPAGLDSGKAMIEYRDIETERFSQTVNMYEDFFVNVIEMMLEEVKSIGNDYQVSSYSTSRGMKPVKWKDIALDKNGYVLQIFPASALPHDPAGRIQIIEMYMRAGLIDPEEGKELMEFPDLKAATDISMAPRKFMRKNIEKILKGEEAELPEPYDDVMYALKVATGLYSFAKLHDYDEEVQQNMRTYIDQVNLIIESLQQQVAEQQEPAQQPQPEQPVPQQ